MAFLRTVAKALPRPIVRYGRDLMLALLQGPGPSVVRRRHAELELSLDFLLSDYRQLKANIAFLQVGANDGKMDDPIFPLIEKHSLRGILIEPQRGCFERLKANYSGFCPSHFTFVNAAIATADGTRPLYRIKPDARVPEWLLGLASFDRSVLVKHKSWPGVPANFESLIEIEDVRCLTFSSLFSELGIQHIDVLQIDAEGYDAEVLRQFDIQTRKPAIVRFEHKHLSWPDHELCLDLLIGAGYRIAIGLVDTMAYNPHY